jgi:hypothetical protein
MTGETKELREKISPSATLSTTNPTRTDPRMNPSLCGERPLTKCLSHDTAMVQLNIKLQLMKHSALLLWICATFMSICDTSSFSSEVMILCDKICNADEIHYILMLC